jgi:hypothetical protein
MSAPEKFTITAVFGDGEHKLSLHDGTLDLVRELERKAGAGCFAVFRQLYSGAYETDTLREVIRLALVGGGKSPSEAHQMVTLYFDKEPLANHIGLAVELLGAVLFGKGVAIPAEFAE